LAFFTCSSTSFEPAGPPEPIYRVRRRRARFGRGMSRLLGFERSKERDSSTGACLGRISKWRSPFGAANADSRHRSTSR
jgi:hypothetical protein